MQKKNSLFKFIFDENPVFALLLGMCTTLAVSTTFEKSLIMGLSISFVLFFSSIIISLIRHFISEEIRIPAYIIIITTFVTAIEIAMRNYAYSVYESLGIYLPLITVNCIILGRALSFASKNNVFSTMKDSLKVGIQYIFAISFLGLIREILGNNTISIMDSVSKLTGYRIVYNVLPSNMLLPNNFFLTSAGAFITLGILVGVLNAIRNRGEGK